MDFAKKFVFAYPLGGLKSLRGIACKQAICARAPCAALRGVSLTARVRYAWRAKARAADSVCFASTAALGAEERKNVDKEAVASPLFWCGFLGGG